MKIIGLNHGEYNSSAALHKDALNTFFNSGLEYLVMEDWLIVKSGMLKGSLAEVRKKQ